MKLVATLLACLSLVPVASLHAQHERSGAAWIRAVDPCRTAKTTLDLNDCLSVQIDSAEQKLSRYLAASRHVHAAQPPVLRALDKSQREWLRYRKAHCDAVYQVWADGTIRNAMAAQCIFDQTRQRTHDLWSAFLTYMDSTPPALPEP